MCIGILAIAQIVHLASVPSLQPLAETRDSLWFDRGANADQIKTDAPGFGLQIGGQLLDGHDRCFIVMLLAPRCAMATMPNILGEADPKNLSCEQNDIREILRLMHESTTSDASTTSLAIETQDLTRFFDDFCAVDSVNVRVERGTLYGFLGPNGAGKSTTIKMLTGILAPTSGSISLLGKSPWNPAEAIDLKKQIGVVPEDLALFDNLTAREYLTFVGRMYLLPRDTIRERSEELLSLLRLEDVEKKLTLEYSHGMRKKLALAAALLPNPALLFLDEPFEGVDAVTSRVIRDLLAGFVKRGSTVFITSHVLEIVERICTHVGIIANGALVEQTSLDELRQGSSLEQRFLDRVGSTGDEKSNLSWLDGGIDSAAGATATSSLEDEEASP